MIQWREFKKPVRAAAHQRFSAGKVWERLPWYMRPSLGNPALHVRSITRSSAYIDADSARRSKDRTAILQYPDLLGNAASRTIVFSTMLSCMRTPTWMHTAIPITYFQATTAHNAFIILSCFALGKTRTQPFPQLSASIAVCPSLWAMLFCLSSSLLTSRHPLEHSSSFVDRP